MKAYQSTAAGIHGGCNRDRMYKLRLVGSFGRGTGEDGEAGESGKFPAVAPAPPDYKAHAKYARIGRLAVALSSLVWDALTDSRSEEAMPRARVSAEPMYPVRVHGTAPIIAQGRAPASVTMDEAVSRWKDRLSAHYTPGSMDRMLSTVRRVAEWAGWRTVDDVKYEDADIILAARRRGDEGIKWSGTTHDQAVSTLRTFGEFLRKRKLRDCNPLIDLEACGEPGGDGGRPLSTKQAEAFILAALNRHWKSRRARGCSPLFWLTLFYTGMRFTEASEILWGDIFEESDGATLITRPELPGNKAGRKDFIPLRADLWRLLTQHREGVPHAAADKVFPIAPASATWHIDRAAAGIAENDPRYGPCVPHSARKTYSTWLDGQCLPSGLVTRLMRQKGTLAEAKYIKHGATDPGIARRALESLPVIWPEAIDVFSIRGTKKLAKGAAMVDTGSTTPDSSPMCIAPQLCETNGPVQALGSGVVTRPSGPGPFVPQSSKTESLAVAVTPPMGGRALDSCRNGQIPERITTRERVAWALAEYLTNPVGDSPQESHDDRVHPVPPVLPPHLNPPPLPPQ